MNPTIPPAYIGGTVQIPPGAVQNLLTLIQQQLASNCPGSAVELQLSADSANSGSVTVGAANQLSGTLSQTNYAYKLTPSSPPRIYRSSYPGNSVPIGDIQLLVATANAVHVEIWT